MHQTPRDPTAAFLDSLDRIIGYAHSGFTPETPIAEILRPDVLDPAELLGVISCALDQEIEDINQSRIRPETDTIHTMMTRLVQP